MPEPLSTSAGPAKLRPRVKVWFESEDGFGFGSGLVGILRAVEAAGSIKGAAERLDQSYRHVWGRVKRAELALGRSLVETQIGGQAANRSGLTDEGRRLVAEYLDLRERMLQLADAEIDRAQGSTRLPLVSKDPAV